MENYRMALCHALQGKQKPYEAIFLKDTDYFYFINYIYFVIQCLNLFQLLLQWKCYKIHARLFLLLYIELLSSPEDFDTSIYPSVITITTLISHLMLPIMTTFTYNGNICYNDSCYYTRLCFIWECFKLAHLTATQTSWAAFPICQKLQYLSSFF